MYNPKQLHECQKEAGINPRGLIDGLMTLIGVIASLSSLPQVVKIWQTGEVAGISLLTQLIALAAVIAWFLYGLYIKNKPLTITSFITILVLGTVVGQILFFSYLF